MGPGINELLRRNIKYLYIKIPIEVFEGLFFLLLLGAIVIFTYYGRKQGWRKFVWLLFSEYVMFIFFSTVILRKVKECACYNFVPFWSYEAIRNGQEILIAQNIMNIVVFVPLGVLLGCAIRNMAWWKVLMIGCGISISIEVLQYFLKRGTAEVDDVMHNTLGCVIGYGIYMMVASARKALSSKRRISGL